MRTRERVDLTIYLRGLGVFARNPSVIVMPLLVAVIAVLVGQISGFGRTDPLTGGLMGFLLQLLQLFAFGVSIIIADAAWRRGGVASFDDAWQEARRKAGDILFAAFGFTFVLQIALLAAGFLGSIGWIVTALAIYGLIFTIPAAAIGGIPGGAAINASVERVRAYPLTAAVLTVVTIVLLLAFRAYVGTWLVGLVYGAFGGSGIVGALLDALVQAIAAGYVATVTAKVYEEVAFSRW